MAWAAALYRRRMRMRWTILAAVAVTAATAGAPRPAYAQHGTAGWGVMPMSPRSSALLEQQTAQFTLPGRTGMWQTWGPRLEYLVVPRFSLAARTALARVDYSDGESAFGLSDSELVALVRLLDLQALDASVSAG